MKCIYSNIFNFEGYFRYLLSLSVIVFRQFGTIALRFFLLFFSCLKSVVDFSSQPLNILIVPNRGILTLLQIESQDVGVGDIAHQTLSKSLALRADSQPPLNFLAIFHS